MKLRNVWKIKTDLAFYASKMFQKLGRGLKGVCNALKKNIFTLRITGIMTWHKENILGKCHRLQYQIQRHSIKNKKFYK